MAKQDDVFAGAEIIGAVGVSAGTAKVVQKLKDGRLAFGTFFVKDGNGTPRSGGMILTVEQWESLSKQAKAGKPVDLSTVTMPETTPRAKKLTQAESLAAGIAEGVQAALAALGVSIPVQNGQKVAAKS